VREEEEDADDTLEEDVVLVLRSVVVATNAVERMGCAPTTAEATNGNTSALRISSAAAASTP